MDYMDPEAVAGPSTVPWDKEKVNTVYLTGRLGQDVELRQVANGGVVARARLAVRRPVCPGQPEETDWFNMEGWDDVARSMQQHLQKGASVQVAGRIAFETYTGRDNVPRMAAKVKVREFHHVEPLVRQLESDAGGDSWAPSPPTPTAVAAAADGGGYAEKAEKRRAEWDAFFNSPEVWWDNRESKKNPRAPDFKHKMTGEGLWIDSKLNPADLEERIREMDEEDYAPDNPNPPF